MRTCKSAAARVPSIKITGQNNRAWAGSADKVPGWGSGNGEGDGEQWRGGDTK